MKRQEVINNTKICSTCQVWKSTEEFYKSNISYTGLAYVCKSCVKIESKKLRDKACPEAKRKISLNHKFRNYGLTTAQVESLPKQCEICLETNDLHIDHDHLTGVVRGILCSGCNRGIGMFKESVSSIQSAIKYLEIPPTRELFPEPVFVQRERGKENGRKRDKNDFHS